MGLEATSHSRDPPLAFQLSGQRCLVFYILIVCHLILECGVPYLALNYHNISHGHILCYLLLFLSARWHPLE